MNTSPMENFEVRDHFSAIFYRVCSFSRIKKNFWYSSFNTKVLFVASTLQVFSFYWLLFIPIWCRGSYSCEPPFFSFYLLHFLSLILMFPLCVWNDSYCLMITNTFISFILSLTLLFLFSAKVTYHSFRFDIFLFYGLSLIWTIIVSGGWTRYIFEWNKRQTRKEIEKEMKKKFDSFNSQVEALRFQRAEDENEMEFAQTGNHLEEIVPSQEVNETEDIKSESKLHELGDEEDD